MARRHQVDNGSGEAGRPRQPLKSHRQILEQELGLAEAELARPAGAVAGSGLLAGLGVCVSVLLVAVLNAAGGATLPEVVHRFLAGNAYAAGFLVVIFARADLFTEYTTIALLPVFFRRATVRSLARLWGLVYAGNMVGVLGGAAVLVWLGTSHDAFGADAFGSVARALTAPSTVGLTLAATVAGWLMGLLSWLIVAARETVSQVVFVWVIGVTIGFASLPHSITGTAEVAAAVMAGAGVAAPELVRFLLLSTIGNALGSVTFALLVHLAASGRPRAEHD